MMPVRWLTSRSRTRCRACRSSWSAAFPRMVRVIEELASDWRRIDERIEGLSGEIEELAKRDAGCERLMSVPGIGPIIASAMVAAIGTGEGFSKGRDLAVWLGLVPKQVSTGDRTILGSRNSSRMLGAHSISTLNALILVVSAYHDPSQDRLAFPFARSTTKEKGKGREDSSRKPQQ